MVEAIVEYEYTASEADELTLRKGDVITNIKTLPGGWWEGTLRGKRGMFPDNFVKLCSEAENAVQDVSIRSETGRQCRVLFSYQPVNEDELELKVNDIIDIFCEVEEGWWKGKCGDSVGVFPSNFVKEITEKTNVSSTNPAKKNEKDVRDFTPAQRKEDPAKTLVTSDKNENEAKIPVLPPKPVKELCRVLYSYTAANDDELTLKVGDIITLLSKDVQDKGWWRGELRGKVGLFPDNFVEVIQQEETSKKPERPPSKSLPAASVTKVSDTVNKPASSLNMKVDATSTTSEVTGRTEEKVSPAPPVPSKKPSLPPPAKKFPQDVSLLNSLPSKATDVLDGLSMSKTSYNVSKVAGSSALVSENIKPGKEPEKKEMLEFDSVERSAMLSHPTASRVKAPRRRLPTLGKENESLHDLTNGDSEEPSVVSIHEEEEQEDQVAKNKIWKKNKAPWMEELKLNQARKNITHGTEVKTSPGHNSPTAPTATSPTATHPIKNTEPSVDNNSLPVSNKGKVEPTQVSAKSVGASSSHENNNSDPPLEVSLTKFNNSAAGKRDIRPHSMYSDSVHLVSQAQPVSRKTLSGDVEQGVDSTKLISHSTKPSALNRLSHPVQALSTTQSVSLSKVNTTNLPTLDTTVEHQTIDENIQTVSYKQYVELKEMVLQLQKKIEQQRDYFTKELKEITTKLKEEVDMRYQIQQDLDRLTNLVTQV